MRRARTQSAVTPKAGSRRLGRLGLALADERGGRVVFVSHCLLNQNTRYPGGAFRPGAVMEVAVPYLRDGAGICQLPCPEQVAWGGVGKPYLVFFWGGHGCARWRGLAWRRSCVTPGCGTARWPAASPRRSPTIGRTVPRWWPWWGLEPHQAVGWPTPLTWPRRSARWLDARCGAWTGRW
jgi:hypothetical protein